MSDNNGLMASVIVVAYNDKKYLEGCLSSLLDQDMPNEDYEVIYADNASTDGSADFVAERFPAVRVVRLNRNYGFAEGNNRGATFARGRYIAFQNADTVVHRRWLPEFIRAMEEDPRVKGCHPAALSLNFGGYNEREAPIEQGMMCELAPFGHVDFKQVSLNGKPVPTLFIAGGSMMIDREIMDQIDYIFDPTYFIYNEDTDLGLRINNLGYKVVFVPSAVTYHQRDLSRRVLLNKKSLRMAFLVTRNRFITFYKNMYSLEFLLALPLLLVGSVAKTQSLNLGLGRRTVYTLGLIPYTLVSLILAAIRFPRYAAQRRRILSNRPWGQFWLLNELWKRRHLFLHPRKETGGEV
jgi:GT2 family glycosyltransferase